MDEQEQQTVWESTLDERYRCVVVRERPYLGHLTVTDTETEEVLMGRDVRLAFDAMVGPDVADVRQWQEMAIEAVDGREG